MTTCPTCEELAAALAHERATGNAVDAETARHIAELDARLTAAERARDAAEQVAEERRERAKRAEAENERLQAWGRDMQRVANAAENKTRKVIESDSNRALREKLATARSEALEEAAKIADGCIIDECSPRIYRLAHPCPRIWGEAVSEWTICSEHDCLDSGYCPICEGDANLIQVVPASKLAAAMRVVEAANAYVADPDEDRSETFDRLADALVCFNAEVKP